MPNFFTQVFGHVKVAFEAGLLLCWFSHGTTDKNVITILVIANKGSTAGVHKTVAPSLPRDLKLPISMLSWVDLNLFARAFIIFALSTSKLWFLLSRTARTLGYFWPSYMIACCCKISFKCCLNWVSCFVNQITADSSRLLVGWWATCEHVEFIKNYLTRGSWAAAGQRTNRDQNWRCQRGNYFSF